MAEAVPGEGSKRSKVMLGGRPERSITQAEIDSATEVIRSLAARTMRGERFVTPLKLYEAVQALTPQPAIEAIMTDGKGRYALHRRPKTDKDFTPNTLHIMGGFEKPDRQGVSPVETARFMAQAEMGATDIEYVAGPIATYQWTRGVEHPTGWPHSHVYVFKVVGDLPEREDIVWFDNNKFPPQEQIMRGRPGEIHMDFLRVYQEWCKNPNQPCRDLNERPLDQKHAIP